MNTFLTGTGFFFSELKTERKYFKEANPYQKFKEMPGNMLELI